MAAQSYVLRINAAALAAFGLMLVALRLPAYGATMITTALFMGWAARPSV